MGKNPDDPDPVGPDLPGADISPDGRYLLTGGMGNFTYWDISRGALLRRYSTELPADHGHHADPPPLFPSPFPGRANMPSPAGRK